MAYKNPTVNLPSSTSKKAIKSTEKIIKKYTKMAPTYFVFLDVLGFKETYNKNTKGENLFQEVFEYFHSLVNEMRCLKEDPKHCYAGQTSDSLYFYTDTLKYLYDFINVFLHFNLCAMSKNIYFRGGIAKGELYYNEPYQFFGDCVISSYLLEENISNYPRITIDEKTIADLESLKLKIWDFDEDANTHRHHLNPFSKTVMQDISEYLTPFAPPLQEINVELIQDIEKNIKNNIKQSEFSNSIFEKYWYLSDRCAALLKSLKHTK